MATKRGPGVSRQLDLGYTDWLARMSGGYRSRPAREPAARGGETYLIGGPDKRVLLRQLQCLSPDEGPVLAPGDALIEGDALVAWALAEDEPAHGLEMYNHDGCRCEICRAAKTEYQRAYREGRRG